jgi:acetyl-CoA carboxylase biotin carboxyl carrier protein
MPKVQIKAELAGNVWKVLSKEGQSVASDETILILESMKMEIPVTAPRAGKVTRLHVKEGDTVQEGQLLAELE